MSYEKVWFKDNDYSVHKSRASPVVLNVHVFGMVLHGWGVPCSVQTDRLEMKPFVEVPPHADCSV